MTLDFDPTVSIEVHSAGVGEVQTHALLERERELERIDAALESACAGAGRMIVIEGAAGIGKTALVDAARVGARARGMTVLDGRGTELEAEYPFGVVRQCLEPVVRAADFREREELFSGAAALAAPVLVDAAGEGGAASFGVLHGLYWLLANLADRGPLLLAIDDAHWGDEPSLRFLAHLRRRVESLPAALVLATRPVDPSDPEPGFLAQMLADPDHEVLAPAALDERAVAELLSESAAQPVDERFARVCHHASGGNPFLLTELARTLREEQVPFTAGGAEQVGEITPPQVARETRARLARLDPAAGALARAIVVLGDDAPLDLACELAALQRPVAAEAADALLSAGLLDSGPLLRFRHPLLRSAVAASLTLFERDGAHRRAAELLRDRGAPPERIAVHLLATTPSGERADARTLRDAATRAVERDAPEAAVPLFLRALSEPLDSGERTSLLLGLGRAELAAGQIAAAAEHLDQARRGAGDPISRARALALLIDASARESPPGATDCSLGRDAARDRGARPAPPSPRECRSSGFSSKVGEVHPGRLERPAFPFRRVSRRLRRPASLARHAHISPDAPERGSIASALASPVVDLQAHATLAVGGSFEKGMPDDRFSDRNRDRPPAGGRVRLRHRPGQAGHLADEHGLRGAGARRPDRACEADPRGASCAGWQAARLAGRDRRIRPRSGVRDADRRGTADPRSKYLGPNGARHALAVQGGRTADRSDAPRPANPEARDQAQTCRLVRHDQIRARERVARVMSRVLRPRVEA